MAFVRDSAGVAHLGGVSLVQLLADGLATPAYVYDVDAIVAEASALARGFDGHEHLVCYAVKANTAGRILRRMAAAGVGADVVSEGELRVAVGAGIPAARIVWSGVAKQDREIDTALGLGVCSIHAESVEELARIEARARAAGVVAPVSLRVNPSVTADTHAHIATGHDEAKFGIALGAVPAALARIADSAHLRLVGLSTHVGSQMLEPTAYVAGVAVLADLVRDLLGRGQKLDLLDLGGGFGVDYGQGTPVAPAEFIRAACALLDARGLPAMRLLCEPGRALVASHGVLLARVIQVKAQPVAAHAGWFLIDAAMNDLLRPALYAARHRIEPVRQVAGAATTTWKVGGPVCESSDDFGLHDLPASTDAVVIREAGAYGYTMASRYNGRAMPTEVFLEGGRVSAVSRVDDVASWIAGRLAT